MKINLEEYSIADMKKGLRPKILLLGNGLNRAFNENSWCDLLDKIKTSKHNEKAENYDMPMPLKATLLTEAKAQTLLNKHLETINLYSMPNDGLVILLNKYIALDFTHILTTNYGYEIETTILDREVSRNILYRRQVYTGENAYAKYLTQIFYKLNDIYVWHIHGEFRRPSSLVLDHKSYCQLVAQYNKHLESIKKRIREKISSNNTENQKIKLMSWIDAFILGDVYIVGLGMDFSEIDLWWLLDEKNGLKSKLASEFNQNILGNTTYFQPQKKSDISNNFISSDECKIRLMETYGVKIEDCGVMIDKNKENAYKKFYELVLDYIKF